MGELDEFGVSIKVQYNDGTGGCFPAHYDNPGPPSKRQLTCLCYANSSWSSGDGGELELLSVGEAPVLLEPLAGRVVFFLSDRVLHQVRPARAPRVCFTFWIDGRVVNGDDDVLLRSRHLSAWKRDDGTLDVARALHMLRQSPLQRSVSRALFDDVYAEGLCQCLGQGTSEA